MTLEQLAEGIGVADDHRTRPGRVVTAIFGRRGYPIVPRVARAADEID
jgi:hypothetical protein